MGTKRLTDRIHVHASGPNQPAFSHDAFEEDPVGRHEIWGADPDERRRRIAARAAKGARETLRQQFGEPA